MILLQMVVMFWINKKVVEMVSKYPMIDCRDLSSTYGADLEKYAVHQWHDLTLGQSKHSIQAFHCFCESVQKTQGFSAAFSKVFSATTNQGEVISGNICNMWITDKVFTQVAKLGVSVLIVVFNLIIRTIAIELIIWIGKKTLSRQMNSILKLIFVSQFFNTCMILFLVHLNLDNSQFLLLKYIFNGKQPDFTKDWYF